MESGSGKTMVVAMLVVGLVIGFGMGYLIPSLATPADDYDVIIARGSIIVGTNSGWPPFEMFNTTSQTLYGFDIDLAELVADYLGVTIDWVDMDFDGLIGACQIGTIDMIASATFITAARAAVLEPLAWYIRTNEVIVVRGNDTSLDSMTSLDDLIGLDVGVQTGTTEDEGASAVSGITVHRYPIVQTMFEDLASGTLDAIFVDEPIVGLYGETYDVKIVFTLTAPPTAFYIRYGSPRLSGAINSAIAEGFADGTIDTLIATWFG
ncbi:MAG: amino acid ABC transporter substrate-binding protein [Candidatus Thorarchaeota archaeon]|nr:MAG: amino acid ABC transporter substrate-binding protein [Candidatus Thorarchaeota archaeon]